MPDPYPTLKPWRSSIHAQCLAHREIDGRTDICRKSKGHKGREHFDPSSGQKWTDDAAEEATNG